LFLIGGLDPKPPFFFKLYWEEAGRVGGRFQLSGEVRFLGDILFGGLGCQRDTDVLSCEIFPMQLRALFTQNTSNSF